MDESFGLSCFPSDSLVEFKIVALAVPCFVVDDENGTGEERTKEYIYVQKVT